MSQLEELIKLFNETLTLTSKKNQRISFDEGVGTMALKIGRLIHDKANRKETDLFLSQCDKAVKYGFDMFAYKLYNYRLVAKTPAAVEILFLAMSVCKVNSKLLFAYRVHGVELDILKEFSARILKAEEERSKESLCVNEIERLMMEAKKHKQYAPPLSKILRKCTIKQKRHNSKKLLMKRVNVYVEKHKDAFIQPHPRNDNITLHPILINPNRKKVRFVLGRKWRSFYLSDGFIAKCAKCEAVITSGFKSMDDYICCSCRYNGFSNHSVWTISK